MIEKVNEELAFVNWEEIIQFRRDLHRHPEISENESDTSRRILEMLENYQPTGVISNLGGHGVLATFEGSEKGPSILIRGDMDALPIAEINNFDYKSVNEGIGHKCGHDGHTSILMGLAALLTKQKLQKGKVILLFQPAEENGAGAQAILKDNKFDVHPDYVFALHNLPGFPMHQVIAKDGVFTASVTSPIIKLSGKTAHAGEPENGINPALAIADILKSCLALSNNHPQDENFTVVTPINISMGEVAYGVSAGSGEIHLTVRAWTDEQLEKLCERIEEEVAKISSENKLEYEVEYVQRFYSNANDSSAMRFLIGASEDLGLDVEHRNLPFKWGEDFGLFTQKFKGAMFGLGAGVNAPMLHNPDYDFPDELIKTGSALFYGIIQKVMNE